MKHYEMLCVLPGTLAEDEVTPLVKEIEAILTEQGGSNITIEDRGKSRLAHPIKHIRYGYFQLFQFEAEPESIANINAKLKLITDLLRALITIFDPKLREDKNKRLSKMASETKVDKVKSKKDSEKPKKAGKKQKATKKEADSGTNAPSQEKKEKIEEKLDKVLDSALDEV